MKEFGDQRIADGEKCLVVDLGGCSGMDSTFMGTLAGMAARLSTQDNARLQIADPGSRNRRSLEVLGLDFLMDIAPPESVWRGSIDKIRSELQSTDTSSPTSPLQRTQLVLEAHQELASKNEKNAKVFSNVVTMLEQDLKEKQRKSGNSGDK
jgi:anti-sigma B factor antagonist